MPMQARITLITAILTDRLGKRPYIEPALTLRPMGWSTSCYPEDIKQCLASPNFDTAEGALDWLEVQVRTYPTEQERQEQKFRQRLAELAEIADSLGYDLAPIRDLQVTAGGNLLAS